MPVLGHRARVADSSVVITAAGLADTRRQPPPPNNVQRLCSINLTHFQRLACLLVSYRTLAKFAAAHDGKCRTHDGITERGCPVTAAMRTTFAHYQPVARWRARAGAWQPQLPQTGNWTQLIEEEFDRSLRVYERPANNDAAYPWRSNCWQIRTASYSFLVIR